MNLVIGKDPDVQAIQRLLMAILSAFRVAGGAGCSTLIVSDTLVEKGMSADTASTLIASLIDHGMLTCLDTQAYAVSSRGYDFLSALEDAYASGVLPPAPPIVYH